MSALILLVGCVGPWFGLDMLFFDEFFLMPLYFISGIVFVNSDSEVKTDNMDTNVSNAEIQVQKFGKISFCYDNNAGLQW